MIASTVKFQWHIVDEAKRGFLYKELMRNNKKDKPSREIIEKLFSKEAFLSSLKTAWQDWCKEDTPTNQIMLPLAMCGLPALVTDAEPRDGIEYAMVATYDWLDSFSTGANGTKSFKGKTDIFATS